MDTWLIALHFGAVRVGGTAYRAFVCVFGVLVALLSVSGVVIWLRKRKKRPLQKTTGPRGRASVPGPSSG